MEDRYIYEVIRIIDGKPLFLEAHFERLAKTLELQGAPGLLTSEDFAQSMSDFIVSERIVNDNVKFILRLDADSVASEFEHIHKHYPTAEEYADGVPTDLLVAMRDNPHAKIHNQSLRDMSDKMIKDNGLFEVILVDDTGFITEGSRSNIFFVKGKALYTSPADGVLLGVTRQEIIGVCEANGIDVIEAPIKASSIDDFDAAFVSGTSPKVLPISRVGNVVYDVKQDTLRVVMNLFDEHIQQYLDAH